MPLDLSTTINDKPTMRHAVGGAMTSCGGGVTMTSRKGNSTVTASRRDVDEEEEEASVVAMETDA